ncbi:hypothetical protein LCGC14_2969240, partial [marine sediment metagenome]
WNASEPISVIVRDAHEASKFTNQQISAQVCSALYCLVIRRFLFEETDKVTDLLISFYAEQDMQEHGKALDDFYLDRPDLYSETKDSSGVFDSFWGASAIFAKNSKDFENAVIQGIILGNDCEVMGYLVGSLVGVALGINEIPQRWLNQLDLSNEAEKVVTNFVRAVEKRN